MFFFLLDSTITMDIHQWFRLKEENISSVFLCILLNGIHRSNRENDYASLISMRKIIIFSSVLYLSALRVYATRIIIDYSSFLRHFGSKITIRYTSMISIDKKESYSVFFSFYLFEFIGYNKTNSQLTNYIHFFLTQVFRRLYRFIRSHIEQNGWHSKPYLDYMCNCDDSWNWSSINSYSLFVFSVPNTLTKCWL